MKVSELTEKLVESGVHTHVTICKDNKDIITFSSDSTDALDLVKDLEIEDWYPVVDVSIPSIVIDLPDTVVSP